jgi:hypothetical protein
LELPKRMPSRRFAQSLAVLSAKDEAAPATAIAHGRELLTVVGNQSNLILDPDLDSYYVMSLTVLRFPELLQVLFETHQFVQNWGRRIPGQNASAEMLTLVGRLDAVLTGVESDYAQAAAAEPALRDRLQWSRNALLQVARHFAQLVSCRGIVSAGRCLRRTLWSGCVHRTNSRNAGVENSPGAGRTCYK